MAKTAARYTYVNGKIVPHEKAVVRVDDIGLTRSFGVYDGIMTYDGEPFEMKLHYGRLSRSARLLGLRVPVSRNDLYNIIKTLIKKNSYTNPIVRTILTGGTTVRGIDYDPKKPTLIVFLEELGVFPEDAFTKGVHVITFEWERQIPEAKTINYIGAVRMQADIRKAKALEALYVHHGQAFEATTCNLFVVKKGKIITPKEGILNGITRQVVLKIARKQYTVEERPLKLTELTSADEVFLTSSFKEVMPVSHIDGKEVKQSPGPVTLDLMQKFKDYVEKRK